MVHTILKKSVLGFSLLSMPLLFVGGAVMFAPFECSAAADPRIQEISRMASGDKDILRGSRAVGLCRQHPKRTALQLWELAGPSKPPVAGSRVGTGSGGAGGGLGAKPEVAASAAGAVEPEVDAAAAAGHMFCGNCGTNFFKNDKFCSVCSHGRLGSCGEGKARPKDDKFCGSCGVSVLKTDRFCHSCSKSCSNHIAAGDLAGDQEDGEIAADLDVGGQEDAQEGGADGEKRRFNKTHAFVGGAAIIVVVTAAVLLAYRHWKKKKAARQQQELDGLELPKEFAG